VVWNSSDCCQARFWESKKISFKISKILEDVLQNVMQKANFMGEKQGALPELGITSGKGAEVVMYPRAGKARAAVKLRKEPHGLCPEELGSGAELFSLCQRAREEFLAKRIKESMSAC